MAQIRGRVVELEVVRQTFLVRVEDVNGNKEGARIDKSEELMAATALTAMSLNAELLMTTNDQSGQVTGVRAILD